MLAAKSDTTPITSDNIHIVPSSNPGTRGEIVPINSSVNYLVIGRDNPEGFPFETISVRVPKIINDIIEENQGILAEDIIKELQALAQEIKSGDTIRTLPEDTPPHILEMWRDLQIQIADRQLTWHDPLPLYPIEKYVYTLLNVVAKHHDARFDIFGRRKEQEFSKPEFWTNLQFFISELKNEKTKLGRLAKALETALRGNTGDFAHITGDMGAHWNNNNILVNHSRKIAQELLDNPNADIHIVADNTPIELGTNLKLIKTSLETGGPDRKIIFHVKGMPLLVSDTTADDVNIFINMLHIKAAQSKDNELFELYNFLEENIRNHRIIIKPDNYWNSGNRSDEISPHIKEQLSAADFVFFMGDMNSRWMTEANGKQALAEIEKYLGFIKNLIRIATFKSQNANFGIPEEISQQLEEESPGFARKGKHGVIMHFENGILSNEQDHILKLSEQ